MGILTYGALDTKNKILEKKIDTLLSLTDYFRKKMDSQRTIIVQLKKLLDSYSCPTKLFLKTPFCDKNHYNCKTSLS